MDQYHLVYNTPHTYCRCRDEYEKLKPIARIYKTYFDKLKEGLSGVEALNSMGLMKMCCRQRFLSIPLDHMIDRSKDRIYNDDDRRLVTQSTRILAPGVQPPDFPALSPVFIYN